MTLYYGKLQRDDVTFYILASRKGVCLIDTNVDEVNRFMKKHSYRTLIEDDEKIESYANQLHEYLDGNRKEFTMNVVLHGTPFQKKVWDALQTIPFGETRSYTDVATMIGNKKAVRAVGVAIGLNPILIVIPCHRVIGKSGKLTGFRGGLKMKRDLLTIERIGNYYC